MKGYTYGSASQQRRRSFDRPYRFMAAIQGLSTLHEEKSEAEMEEFVGNLLVKYLKQEPEGTLKVLEIEGPFTVEELVASTIVLLHCEILCRTGRFNRLRDGSYALVGLPAAAPR